MPSLVLAPFPDLRVDDPESVGAVRVANWVINRDREVSDGMQLRGWDYGAPLTLSRELVIDGGAIQRFCGLGEGATICVTALWGTGGSYHAWEVATGERLTLQGEDSRSVQLNFRVPSDHLAGQVNVATHIVLEKTGRNPYPASAVELGSILWEDLATVRLEGNAARLSVTTEEFRNRFGEREGAAAWTLSVAPDWLNAHPSVGLQVIFNKLNEAVIDAVRHHRPGSREKAIRSAIAFDIGRQMIVRALLDEEGFCDHSEFDKDTSGAAVQAQLRTIFAGMSVEKVRALYRDENDRFERLLQAHHKLFTA